jgi:FlaG/FlaF family flagellin (archaellin)
MKDRLFYIVVTVALLVMAALVIDQTAATAKVVSGISSQATNHSDQATATLCFISAEDVQSIRLEYVKGLGIWLPRTDLGYTGRDDGILSLLYCWSESNQ